MGYYFTHLNSTAATRWKSGRAVCAKPKQPLRGGNPNQIPIRPFRTLWGPCELKAISHHWRTQGEQPLRASARPAGSRRRSRRHGFARTKKPPLRGGGPTYIIARPFKTHGRRAPSKTISTPAPPHLHGAPRRNRPCARHTQPPLRAGSFGHISSRIPETAVSRT